MLRGIDRERGLYFLLTPVEPSVLRSVNCLLLGAVLLPSCILTSQVRVHTSCEGILFVSDERCLCPPPPQPGFDGETPYLTTDYSFDLSGAGKLRIFKGLIRPSQAGPR